LSYGLVGLAALLGTLCGRAVAPKEAKACLCNPPHWSLELDPASTDATRWPEHAVVAPDGSSIYVSGEAPDGGGVVFLLAR